MMFTGNALLNIFREGLVKHDITWVISIVYWNKCDNKNNLRSSFMNVSFLYYTITKQIIKLYKLYNKVWYKIIIGTEANVN